jgi:hypothetical protein
LEEKSADWNFSRVVREKIKYGYWLFHELESHVASILLRAFEENDIFPFSSGARVSAFKLGNSFLEVFIFRDIMT